MSEKCRETISTITKAFRLGIAKKSKCSLLFSFIGFAVCFIPTAEGIVLQRFTDALQAYFETGGDLQSGIQYFVFLSILYICQTGYNFAQSYFAFSDTANITEYLKKTVLEKSCNVEYKYIENYDNYLDKISFVNTQVGEHVASCIQSIFSLAQNIITFVLIFIVLGRVSLGICVLLILSCLPTLLLSTKQTGEKFYANTKLPHLFEIVMNDFTELVGPTEMTEVRFWKISSYLKKQWRKDADVYETQKEAILFNHLRQNCLADFLRNIVYVAVLLIAIFKICANPALGIGVFPLVYTLSTQMQRITIQIFTKSADFIGDMKYMREFFSLNELEEESAKSVAQPFATGSIEFQDVSFQYPGSDSFALNHVNIRIAHGETVAIVGENGSGKSTFLNLLCGFFSPTNGAIFIDGYNIHSQLPTARHTISAVFQDFNKYEASIKENIIISLPQREYDEECYKKVCTLTAVQSILNETGMSDETRLGGYSENGTNLSGGQWQHIAIARALYQSDAKVMALDEPTAALDPLAEVELYKNFDTLTHNKTTLLITHRLAICKYVKRILVFKDGEIIEDGSHQDLLKQNGVYAEMYNAQSKWYK